MRLVWANCLQYNGKGSKYGKIGDRCSSMFEELWAASGLDSGDRHRRTNAGHAATRSAFPHLDDFLVEHASWPCASICRSTSLPESLSQRGDPDLTRFKGNPVYEIDHGHSEEVTSGRYEAMEDLEPSRPIRKQPSARTTSIQKTARHSEEVCFKKHHACRS